MNDEKSYEDIKQPFNRIYRDKFGMVFLFSLNDSLFVYCPVLNFMATYRQLLLIDCMLENKGVPLNAAAGHFVLIP